MKKLNKEFFEGNEVIFMGYSSKQPQFSKMIYQAFADNGIKVYPVNSKEGATYDVKVYKKMDELPSVPKTAFILMKKEHAQKVLNELAQKGVRKVLFQNGSVADQEILDQCKGLGMEALVACPMMGLGKGIHRIHAFFAGVKR